MAHRAPAEIATEALRTECEWLLAQCTGKQKDLFAKLFPEGIAALSGQKLEHAIGICQRTLDINDAKKATKE